MHQADIVYGVKTVHSSVVLGDPGSAFLAIA